MKSTSHKPVGCNLRYFHIIKDLNTKKPGCNVRQILNARSLIKNTPT